LVDFNTLNPNIIFDFNLLVPGGLRYFAFVLRSDPLVYLRLQEENGSETAVDFTSYNNDANFVDYVDGVLYQQTSPLTNDKRDYSVRLFGGFINIPNSASLDQAFNAFGADMWVRFPVMPIEEQTLLGRGNGPGLNHFQVSVVPDGRVKFWLKENEADKLAFSESPMIANEWYHVMVIWDGNQIAIFLNGDQGPSVSHSPTLEVSGNPIQVGAYNNASRLEAFVDEVAVYGTSLTQDDADLRTPFHKYNNAPPIIHSTTANGLGPSGHLQIYEGDTVTFVTNATDPDNDTLQYLFSASGFVPEFGPQLGNTLEYQFTEAGFYYPVAFVTDGRFNRAAPFARITVSPLPDLLAFNDSYTTGYQRSKTLDVLQNDTFPVGGGGSISGWTQPSYGALTLTGSGENAGFNYVPFSDSSGVEDTFTYTITNGAGAFASANVNVFVAFKQPPIVRNTNFVVGPGTTTTLRPQSNDLPDPYTQTMTLTTVQNPTSEGGTAVLNTDLNRVVYTTPPGGFLGFDTFVYQAEDEDGLSGEATVTVEVKQITFQAVSDSYTVDYETTRTFSILSNDRTPFGDPLWISSVTQPGGGTVTIINDDTQIEFVAAPGFVGNTTCEYTMTDGTNVDSAFITFNVRNDPPVPGNVRVSTMLDTSREINPLALAYDKEGEPIKLVSFTQPANGSLSRNENGTPGDLTDDTLAYTPNVGFMGLDSFNYTIEDAIGQQGSRDAYIVVDYVMSINVSPTSAPVQDNVSLSVTVTGQSGYDKSYSYFWDFGDGGTSTSPSILRIEVTCTVTDSYGVVKSLSQMVTIGANQAPIANDVYTEVAESQLLVLNPRTNDSDPDGDQFFVAEVQSVTDMGGAAFVNNAGTPGTPYDDYITYTHPLLDTPFSDSFTYTIEDPFGLQASATIYVNILANLPPAALAVFRPTIYNTPVDIYVLNAVSDPEDDPLYVQSVSSVTGGSASIQGSGPNNFVRFTPTNGFLGVASFLYTARDTFYNNDTSNVTIPVFGQYYPKLVHTDAPIAFWPLNDSQGSRAYDMMASQINGTYVNNVPRVDEGPLAKDLDNTANVDQGYIQLPLTTVASQFEDQFTLEFWIKNTSVGSSSIIADWMTVTLAGQTFQFHMVTSDGSKTLTIPNMEVNEWYHICITYDGDWIRGYVDSFAEASTTHTGDVLLPNRWTFGQGLTGYLSMIALYNRRLSQAEITAHYQESLGPIVSYDVEVPENIQAGEEFDVVIKGRDITGKTVKTDNSTEVSVFSDGDIEFDADGDNDFGV